MKESEIKNRLSKILAACGVASRRACEELIFAGKVKVNGQIVTVPQTLVTMPHDRITVNGKPVHLEEKKVYYILNKPAGYVCSNLKNANVKVVLDLFADVEERIFTVGRLDKNTEGLLLVTNDGHFANSVIHPSSNIPKEYVAKTDHEILPEHLMAISSGTLVEGVFVKPISVKKVRKGTVKISITEGKKHEVRLLLEMAGLNIIHLMRIRVGGLLLGTLPLGSWREMTEREKELVFAS